MACTMQRMRETRFPIVRFALAGIIPAAVLAACGASTGSQQRQGGAGSTAGSGTGGSTAGAGAGDVGGSAGPAGAGSGGSSGGGGVLNQAGAGGTSGAAGHAGASGANTGGENGGPLPCGGTTCGASQYCVIPCCGGAPPACVPMSSDGNCPAGTHSGCSFNFGQCTSPGDCCQYDPCIPPAPYCADKNPGGCFPDAGQPRVCRMACA